MTGKKFAVAFDTNSYRGFVNGKSTNKVLADIVELKKVEAKKNIQAYGIMIVGAEMLANLVEGDSGFNYKDCLNGVIAMSNHCFDEAKQSPRIIPQPYLHITHSFFGIVPAEIKKRTLNMGGVVHDFKIDYEKAIEEHTKRSTFKQIKNYLEKEETAFAIEIVDLIEGAKKEVQKKYPRIIVPKELKKKLLDFINNGDYENFISWVLIEATAVTLNLRLTEEDRTNKAFSLKSEFPLSVGFYKWISNEIIDRNIDMQSKNSKSERWNWLWDYQVSFLMSDHTLDNREIILVTSDGDMTKMLNHFGYQNKVMTISKYLEYLKEP